MPERDALDEGQPESGPARARVKKGVKISLCSSGGDAGSVVADLERDPPAAPGRTVRTVDAAALRAARGARSRAG